MKSVFLKSAPLAQNPGFQQQGQAGVRLRADITRVTAPRQFKGDELWSACGQDVEDDSKRERVLVQVIQRSSVANGFQVDACHAIFKSCIGASNPRGAAASAG